ncbi:Integrase family protein [Methylocella tundrae]|uniref:Integrase family protein n=1 Tax=Methylocella tundrae TaxID=227605 RepID=A0A8B6M5F5_METTU|nr:site-specific integrase [Methylocella tundrae]VTZ25970.1 Integrase family protein [Methylocella tundrae]VTZ49570.1 Integrase family protein [Methylocella tundrae]
MVKKINRLSARTIATLSKPGRHADGGGLYLKVDAGGAKRWTFMWMRAGRQREAGLGSVIAVPLVKAREIAASYRAVLADGGDPIESRQKAQAEKQGRKTFGDVANEFLLANEPSWRNAKHRAQWRMTLEVYGKALMPVPVENIETTTVLEALKPIWQTKPETASRLRGRIEAVLDAARVAGHTPADRLNPARWKGHLDKLLPKPNKLSRGHHAAMPYLDVPRFVSRLRERETIGALALEFLILTAARTGEALGAEWPEFDLAEKLWTVPAARMKAGREHRVPLPPRAVEIIEQLAKVRTGAVAFPGQRLDKPLSNMALEMALRRLGVHDATVHGFRSAFRDWCGEETHFPREIAEAALAHVTGDKTELAYRRGDALEKRRSLMEAWGEFLTPSRNPASIDRAATSGSTPGRPFPSQ